ncbi:MAG: lipopolysaccharide heptosyltransferase II [Candidatus Zixiibacteriota bacterium]
MNKFFNFTANFIRIHQVDYYLELVRSLGCQLNPGNPLLIVSEEQQKEAEQLLKILGIEKSEKLVGISPGATYGSAKQWFPENYSELADRITQNLGARILLFGSRGDKKIASQVIQKTRIPLVDLTGDTTLGQAMALASRCCLFISNDSGLMHVAAALRVPLIAIFGSTDPKRTGPRGENCRVIRKYMPCSPCMKAECTEDRRCMSLISVDEVYHEAVRVFKRD